MEDRILDVLKTYNYDDFKECTRTDIIDVLRISPEDIILSLLEIIDRLEN